MQKIAFLVVAALALPLAAHAQTTDRTKVTVKPNAVATTTVTGHNCVDPTGRAVKCAKTETTVKTVATTHGTMTKTATSTAQPCGVKRNGHVKVCVNKTKTVTPN